MKSNAAICNLQSNCLLYIQKESFYWKWDGECFYWKWEGVIFLLEVGGGMFLLEVGGYISILYMFVDWAVHEWGRTLPNVQQTQVDFVPKEKTLAQNHLDKRFF